jgi:hypothetical protein
MLRYDTTMNDADLTIGGGHMGGKELQPNESYSKAMGDIACGLGFWTAYSEPGPPAFSMVINCSKKVNHE